MTEPIFKAPLPPQEDGVAQPSTQEQAPTQGQTPVQEQAAIQEKTSAPVSQSQDIKQKILPYLWYALGGTFAIGLILGIMMGGGSESAPVAQECPLRYVKNPDIQRPLPLCGRTDRTSACVLFIMNTARYDAYAEDFFERAGQLTERNRILISTDNPIYAKSLIRPGEFAQIKIPAKN